MRAPLQVIAVCIALSTVGTALAQTEPIDREIFSTTQLEEAQLEEILVTGERQGSGLWKVSQGDHILWILGLYAPLAEKLTWRSAEVEALIARSQQFLVRGGAKWDIEIGIFQAIALFPAMMKAGKVPDGGKLQDILPSEVYARWQVLQQKYMPHETAERMRPSFAAQSLLNNAYQRSELAGDAGVWAALRRIARKHDLKIRTLQVHEVKLEVKGGRAILKEFSQTPLAGVECLTTTVDRLESDIELLRARANAWATGNVKVLRELLHEPLTPSCADALMNELLATGFGKDTVTGALDKAHSGLSLALERADREWLEATQTALAENAATFAVMPIHDLLEENGYVSKLRALGYSIEEPE